MAGFRVGLTRKVLLTVLAASIARSGQQEKEQLAPPEIIRDERGNIYTIAPEINRGVISIRVDSTDNKTVTVQLPIWNQVRPTVRLRLSKNSENYICYRYELANGLSEGVKPIQSIDMVIPAETSLDEVEAPEGWQSGVTPSEISTVAYSLNGALAGSFLSWYVASSAAEPLIPGNSLSGFQVKSRWLPGVVYSYARTVLPDNRLSEFPEKIGRTVAKYFAPEYASRLVFTVGPLYGPEVLKEEIAGSYLLRLAGIRDLVGAEDRKFIFAMERAIRVEVETADSRSSRWAFLCSTLRQVPADTSFQQAVPDGLAFVFCRE